MVTAKTSRVSIRKTAVAQHRQALESDCRFSASEGTTMRVAMDADDRTVPVEPSVVGSGPVNELVDEPYDSESFMCVNIPYLVPILKEISALAAKLYFI